MPHFTFKAKRSSGEVYTGDRDAEDKYELYRMLRDSGDEVVSVDEPSNSKLKMEINIAFLNRIKAMDKINFARNLGAMLKAGLALSRALSVLERQSKNKNFKKILNDLITNVNQGNTFADSLAKFPKTFSPLFVSMVHAGEQSGTLADSLSVVATQMDSMHTLEKRIKGALMYPAVIVFAMVLIGILMFIFVVPTLLKTFTDLNVELPMSTQVIVALSNIIQNHGLIALLVIFAVMGLLYWWTRKTTGQKALHMFIIKAPVLGPLVQEVNTARTARTLSSLMASGVDVVEAVAITETVVQNVHFKAILSKAGEAIKKGDLMSKVFSQYTKMYPVFFGEMMSVGEETGKTGEMLLGVAKYYEDDVEQKTKDMSTVIEPFLIVIIGAAVGFFAISMISPMYSLVNVI